MNETRHELRCECSRHPVLCHYGVSKTGNMYVHVRVMRQDRELLNMVTYDPECEIRCRNCGRWYTIRFRADATAQTEINMDPPDEAVPAP